MQSADDACPVLIDATADATVAALTRHPTNASVFKLRQVPHTRAKRARQPSITCSPCCYANLAPGRHVCLINYYFIIRQYECAMLPCPALPCPVLFGLLVSRVERRPLRSSAPSAIRCSPLAFQFQLRFKPILKSTCHSNSIKSTFKTTFNSNSNSIPF